MNEKLKKIISKDNLQMVGVIILGWYITLFLFNPFKNSVYPRRTEIIQWHLFNIISQDRSIEEIQKLVSEAGIFFGKWKYPYYIKLYIQDKDNWEIICRPEKSQVYERSIFGRIILLDFDRFRFKTHYINSKKEYKSYYQESYSQIKTEVKQ